MAKARRRKRITAEDKQQIIELARGGMCNADIGEQLDIDGRTVSGVVVDARKRGLVGANPAPTPPTAPRPTFLETRQAETQPIPAAVSDFSWQPSRGVGAGPNSSLVTRFTIERVHPPDGILAVVKGSLSLEKLGDDYGMGTYKIIKQEPGKIAVEDTVTLGEPYGPSRYPERTPARTERTGPRPPRPIDRGYRDPYFDRMAQFGRPSAGQGDNNNVAAEALRQMGQMTRTLMDPKTKPIADVNNSSTEAARLEGILKDDRDRTDQRQKDERSRDEERRKDEQERWERREQEREAEHKRALALSKSEQENRIRLEEERRKSDKAAEEERRKSDRELFNNQMALVRQEGEIRQKALEAELAASRKKTDEMQIAVQQELHEQETRAQERFKEKEKHLDREHDLRREVLATERKAMESSAASSDMGQIAALIKESLKEISGTVNRAIDLKEIEAVAGAPGAGGPPPAEPGTLRGTVRGRSSPVDERPATNGNGRPDAADETATSRPREEIVMKDMVEKMVKEPFFEGILDEWTAQITGGSHPAEFADFFLELLQHHDQSIRLKCKAFKTFMSARSWPHFFKVLSPHLSDEHRTVFESETAGEFYEGFRSLVHHSVLAYYNQLIGQTQAPNPEPAPEPVPAPQETKQT